MGGLVAAGLLAARGLAVTVLERDDVPGGKLRPETLGGRTLDAGPTVLTLRRVFEEVFAEMGVCLDAELTLRPAEVLARHAWGPDETLDLHADPERSAEAVAALAGPAEGRGYRDFLARARRTHRLMEGPFLRAERPTPLSLAAAAGPLGLADLWGAAPFSTLWDALGTHFRDPRLRQLFGRYATYCGASPFRATAALMLIAHVEQEGVWLVEGGMHRLGAALAGRARALGAEFRTGAHAEAILVEGGRAAGVRLSGGEVLRAGAVVSNADAAALAAGLLGREAARALRPPARRSLSALTWLLLARAGGFPLSRHTVFFSPDYAAEFRDLDAGRLPAAPTLYACAQDRDARDGDASDGPAPEGPERLLLLVNAPPSGDARTFAAGETAACERAALGLAARCGLALEAVERRETTPADWAARFPGTGGALYGLPPEGWAASFARPGARTALPGLYLAGGGAHPGAGVPMAALSGRHAARALLADLGSR